MPLALNSVWTLCLVGQPISRGHADDDKQALHIISPIAPPSYASQNISAMYFPGLTQPPVHDKEVTSALRQPSLSRVIQQQPSSAG